MSLAISEEAIEVRGFGPARKLLETFGVPSSMQPRETVMWTTSIGESIGRWRVPWTEREWVALTCPVDDGSEYTIALRPSDGDLDHLRDALRAAGVRES